MRRVRPHVQPGRRPSPARLLRTSFAAAKLVQVCDDMQPSLTRRTLRAAL